MEQHLLRLIIVSPLSVSNLIGNMIPIKVIPSFLDAVTGLELFDLLRTSTPWNHVSYNKPWGQIFTPRLTNCYGFHNWSEEQRVSNVEPRKIPDYLQTLLERVQAVSEDQFNFILMSLYRDGRDSISWHSDDERFLGPNPTIASLSLGGSRRFLMRHKQTKEKTEIQLNHGDLVIMHSDFQHKYEHHVPKTKKKVDPRINLTFRNAINLAGSANYYKYNVGVDMGVNMLDDLNNAGIAQLVEQEFCKLQVPCSSHGAGTT